MIMIIIKTLQAGKSPRRTRCLSIKVAIQAQEKRPTIQRNWKAHWQQLNCFRSILETTI